MADLTEKPKEDENEVEAENAAVEGTSPQQQPPMLTPSPILFTPLNESEDDPLIASLKQRLTVEEFNQLMSKYSEGFIRMYGEQYGEDAVVALARKEAAPFFAEIQQAPILTRRFHEPVEALQPKRQVPPAIKQLSASEKIRLLASLRERLGDELFEYEQQQIGDDNLALMVDQLGEEQAVELIRNIAGAKFTGYPGLRSREVPEAPPATIHRPVKKVRTREMGSTLNRRVVQVALIYTVLIGAFYPDFSAFSQIYDVIFPVAFIIIFLVAVVNFFKTGGFDISTVFSWAVVAGIILGGGFGLVVNVIDRGVKTLAAAGIAFTGAFLVGMLLGKPIFRWIERRQLEERHGLYVGIGVALGLAVLIAGWWGIDTLVKLLLR